VGCANVVNSGTVFDGVKFCAGKDEREPVSDQSAAAVRLVVEDADRAKRMSREIILLPG
jgi:hypothetical protein